MFLNRKKSQRFGASSFSKFHHTRQKNPFATPRSYREQKHHFAIVRFSERCSYHTDWLRFVLLISDPSALDFSQFVRFQNSPNLSKIEKVAETCEFDGKEPLFVERTIAISKRVLGWVLIWYDSRLENEIGERPIAFWVTIVTSNAIGCTTNNLFRLHNNEFDEIPCKLDSTEYARSFRKYPTLIHIYLCKKL